MPCRAFLLIEPLIPWSKITSELDTFIPRSGSNLRYSYCWNTKKHTKNKTKNFRGCKHNIRFLSRTTGRVGPAVHHPHIELVIVVSIFSRLLSLGDCRLILLIIEFVVTRPRESHFITGALPEARPISWIRIPPIAF